MKNNKLKISEINKYLILIISLIFLYLFYLSIPTLYDKDSLQKDLSLKLSKEFQLNLSLSPSIKYLIMPSPHFEIRDIKLYKDIEGSSRELAQIKKLKIFISQKNFFNNKNISIKKIIISNSNFVYRKDDLDFYNNYISKKLTDKSLEIKKK